MVWARCHFAGLASGIDWSIASSAESGAARAAVARRASTKRERSHAGEDPVARASSRSLQRSASLGARHVSKPHHATRAPQRNRRPAERPAGAQAPARGRGRARPAPHAAAPTPGAAPARRSWRALQGRSARAATAPAFSAAAPPLRASLSRRDRDPRDDLRSPRRAGPPPRGAPRPRGAARSGRRARAAHARLAVFVAALAVAALAWGASALSAWWLLAPAAAFVVLAVRHDRIFRDRDRARRAVAFHEAALARVDGRFAGRGVPGDRFADPEHPYAADLDLFGSGSLFELLCVARTHPGEERLAAWLRAPAPADVLRERQRAVAALAPRLDLREDLAVLGDDVRAGVDAAALAAWGTAPPHLPEQVVPAALVLALAGIAAVWAWLTGHGALPLVAVLVLAWGFRRAVQAPLERVLGGLGRPAAELHVLALLLARLEREPFDEPRLAALQARLRAPAPASARIAALVALAARMEWAQNQFFAPVGFVLQWTPLHAARVERWRAANGAAVARLARLRRRARGAVVPRRVLLRAGRRTRSPRSSTRVRSGARSSRGCAPPPAPPGAVANDVRARRGRPPGPARVGIEHVREEHVPAHGRRQRGARARRREGARRPARAHPGPDGRDAPHPGLAPGGKSRFYAEITRLKQLADLAAGPLPAPVPARRDPARHEQPRPAHRRRGHRARPRRSAARSGSSRRTTSPSPRSPAQAARSRTPTSRTRCGTARSCSITGCGPASCSTRTRWR